MRYLLIVLALMVMPFIANAGEALKVCGLEMPCSCEIDCVYLDIDCCCDGSEDAILVEFVGADDMVLGSVSLGGPWCGPCYDGGYYGTLDNPVDPRAVEYVRLSSGEDMLDMDWMCLKVRSKGWCCNYDWDKVFKGDMCCYDVGTVILY